MPKKYSFVLDADGKQLDPTIEQNAWRLVRQKKARLVSKFPNEFKIRKYRRRRMDNKTDAP